MSPITTKEGKERFPQQLFSKKTAIITAGILTATALGFATDRLRRKILIPANQFRVSPPMEDIVSHIRPNERSLGIKPGIVDTLITQGDSTCYPNGDPQSVFESFSQVAAKMLGIPGKNVHNLGIVGIGIPEVRLQLQDATVRNLFLTALKPVLITCLNGNDWRAMVSERMRKHIENLRQITSPTLTQLIPRLPSVFAISRRHSDTAQAFENEYFKYLLEIGELNHIRIASGMEPLRVVLTTPPDFSKSPGITFVPTDGNKTSVESETFHTSEDSVRRVTRIVATTVTERVLLAKRHFKKNNTTLSVAMAPLGDVAWEPEHFWTDQHLNPDTHQRAGIYLTGIIAPVA